MMDDQRLSFSNWIYSAGRCSIWWTSMWLAICNVVIFFHWIRALPGTGSYKKTSLLVFTGRFSSLTYEKKTHNSRFALFSPCPWIRALPGTGSKKKHLFFNISGVYWSIFEFDIWKNSELQPLYNEYSSKFLLCVLCALLTDLTDFEFQKLL